MSCDSILVASPLRVALLPTVSLWMDLQKQQPCRVLVMVFAAFIILDLDRNYRQFSIGFHEHPPQLRVDTVQQNYS